MVLNVTSNYMNAMTVQPPTQRISKRNSTGNASWGGTTIKKYFFYRKSISYA
ncbi:hypothetical protein AAGX16_13840 [Staphylococcus aureus]